MCLSLDIMSFGQETLNNWQFTPKPFNSYVTEDIHMSNEKAILLRYLLIDFPIIFCNLNSLTYNVI